MFFFNSSSKSQCEVYNLTSNVFWWHLLQAKTKLSYVSNTSLFQKSQFWKTLHILMRVWKKVKRIPLNVYTYRIKTRLQELVSTIRYFSRADLWSGFSAYRTSQDMIGLFNFFFKYYWTNVLHVTFYTTIDLGAHFYRYFYETTDRCKSYLDQQIEHEIWFSRQLVWQYWQNIKHIPTMTRRF